ncbi:MAG: LacI family transcriptional regulator [Pedobacter sp.]|nr:MAG: LacI family transcriptional regulator [Pedobacter sp.]
MLKSDKKPKVTIYHLAQELGLAPSSVSKALNDLPSISQRIKDMVSSKARELNYVHNSSAANLRRGSSRTIGVVVPKLDTTFFSDVVSGIEEVCSKHKYNVIICQSEERLQREIEAVENLISQNVDCIIISLSVQTSTVEHLQRIRDLGVNLIQFDRVNEDVKSHYNLTDNKDAAYNAVRHLISNGYSNIALLGGPNHLANYRDRKTGYLQAMEEAELSVPYNYVTEEVLSLERSMDVASNLLNSKNPPDAFFAVSDYAALGAMKAAESLGLKVPDQLGIVGFSNEEFTSLITPSITSIDQNSKQLGAEAARTYFDEIVGKPVTDNYSTSFTRSSLIVRSSSTRTVHAPHDVMTTVI